MSDNPALLRRLRDLSFEAELDDAARLVGLDGATAVLSPSLPLLWDASFLLVEREGMDAARVEALAAEAFSGSGLPHLAVTFRAEGEGARLAGDLAARGWEPDVGLYMVQRSPSLLEARVEVAERPLGEIREAVREVMAECFAPGYGEPVEAVGDQLLAAATPGSQDGGRRWFTAELHGRPAACCRLSDQGGIGEIEYVGTLGAARGHGLARSVVLAAAEASRDRGDELTFLQADRDDWPATGLYERLGFETVGTDHAFVRREPRP
ncbi:MAG: GNAT family N-acetyltransferase [Actinobacteria bacterium]|nr:GNAT family N-acetyltransferase [Actinomycetota bacterium]